MRALEREITALRDEILFEEKKIQHVKIDHENFTITFLNNGKVYKASPTGKEFHASTDLVRAVMGPINSGKSTMHTMDPVFDVSRMPAFTRDGVRRGRYFFSRNTYPDLKGTTLKSWMEWFEDFGEVPHDREKRLKQDSPFNYRTLFNDGKGWIDLEVVFLALDDEKDARKLDSGNFTGGFINEARYMHERFVERGIQRVRRYPDPSDIGGHQLDRGGLTLDTNPPNHTHWWVARFEDLKPPGHKLWKQPPGLIELAEGEYKLNLEAENLDHMPHDYYLNLAASMKNKEEIKVMILNQYGVSSNKEAVFPEFNSDIHAARGLKLIDKLPVYIGWDFGSTPACVIGQVTLRGRIIILKEFISAGGGLEALIEDVVLPYKRQNLQNFDIISWIDPAGMSANDNDGKHCKLTLQRMGFDDVRAPSTNKIEPRLESVRRPLRKLIDGKGGLVIDRDGCPVLFEGMVGEYTRKPVRTVFGVEYGDPLKDFFSHVQDALQALTLGAGQSDEQKPESSQYRTQFVHRRGFA